MPNPLYRTSVTGVRAQQLALDITANNLANVNTTGYKRLRADFRDLFYQRLQADSLRWRRPLRCPDTLLRRGRLSGDGPRPGCRHRR
jgi:flagellar basal body rod protein FlgG